MGEATRAERSTSPAMKYFAVCRNQSVLDASSGRLPASFFLSRTSGGAGISATRLSPGPRTFETTSRRGALDVSDEGSWAKDTIRIRCRIGRVSTGRGF